MDKGSQEFWILKYIQYGSMRYYSINLNYSNIERKKKNINQSSLKTFKAIMTAQKGNR